MLVEGPHRAQSCEALKSKKPNYSPFLATTNLNECLSCTLGVIAEDAVSDGDWRKHLVLLSKSTTTPHFQPRQLNHRTGSSQNGQAMPRSAFTSAHSGYSVDTSVHAWVNGQPNPRGESALTLSPHLPPLPWTIIQWNWIMLKLLFLFSQN